MFMMCSNPYGSLWVNSQAYADHIKTAAAEKRPFDEYIADTLIMEIQATIEDRVFHYPN